MFLPPEIKQELDERIRKDLAPEFAERIISDNRAVRAYLIQAEAGRVQIADHCWTDGTHWETLERVVCDFDDAIAHAMLTAKKHRISHTGLKIVREDQITEN